MGQLPELHAAHNGESMQAQLTCAFQGTLSKCSAPTPKCSAPIVRVGRVPKFGDRCFRSKGSTSARFDADRDRILVVSPSQAALSQNENENENENESEKSKSK